MFLRVSLIIASVSLFLVPALRAQGKMALEAAVKTAGGKAVSAVHLPKPAYFELGNAYIKFSPDVMRVYRVDLKNRFFDAQLNHVLYPKLSRANDGRILNSALSFLGDKELFMKHREEIAGAIRGRVLAGAVPYKEFLPKNAENLYLGEVHGIPRVAREVENLIRALPSIYPGRKIYLALEFLPAFESTPFPSESAVTDSRKMAQLPGGDDGRLSVRALNAALESGIAVIGLEPETAIVQKLIRETSLFPTQEMYEEFCTSFQGMRFRNQTWSKRLRALRRADPDALIVVYAGMDHVGYHNDSALPFLVGGSAFVVQFTTPQALRSLNPLFAGMREEEPVRRTFCASPDAKLVEWWDRPSAFKKLLGNDLTVIVHPK